MKKEKYYLVIFKSKSYAIQLQYILENLGYSCFKLISTPCELNAGCSYSIKFTDLSYLEILKREAKSLNTDIEKFYSIEKKDGKKIIRNLDHLI